LPEEDAPADEEAAAEESRGGKSTPAPGRDEKAAAKARPKRSRRAVKAPETPVPAADTDDEDEDTEDSSSSAAAAAATAFTAEEVAAMSKPASSKPAASKRRLAAAPEVSAMLTGAPVVALSASKTNSRAGSASLRLKKGTKQLVGSVKAAVAGRRGMGLGGRSGKGFNAPKLKSTTRP
jgi:hypothetical protein